MDATVSRRSTSEPARTVIVRRTSTAALTLEPRRRRDRLIARLMATVLDPRLARGVAPESGHLLASRAAHLVDPRNLASLADAWEKVIERATPSRTAVDPRVPVARNAVRAVAAEITALAAALRRGSPVQARDVARATLLLTESDSPVYTGRPGLRTALVELTNAIISGETPSKH